MRRAPSWAVHGAARSGCRARGRQPAAAGGQWLVIFVFRSQIGAPFSRTSQTGARNPNAFSSAICVPLLEKPMTNRKSRAPGIVMHFGLCPAVTRRAHSRHERFKRGCLPRMVYSMAGILCPQTSDTFPSFRATSGTGYRMQSNRRSVAVQSRSAWWVCPYQCGVPRGPVPLSPAFPWDR